MSTEKTNLVRFLCVDVKSEETQEKLKTKLLKAIHNSEKKTTPTSSITHPLQPWHEDVHTLPDLRAEDITKAVANSSHVAFLLRNGQVCRIRVASWEESSSAKTMSLDALRQSQRQQGEVSSFQVLGDEELAQQLYIELNSRGLGLGGQQPYMGGAVPRHYNIMSNSVDQSGEMAVSAR